MKTILLLYVFSFSVAIAFAQKQTFDLASYTPPKDSTGKRWKKEVTETITSFTITNKKNNSWCRIAIVKSTISKGSIEKDFESEWQELIVKNFTPKDAPQPVEVQEKTGWKIKTGVAKFIFNKMDAIAMLTTMSGYERCVSIISTTNNQEYLKNITDFLSSVEVIKPGKLPDNKVVIKEGLQQPLTNSKGFAFTTTNFDDGWTSSAKEDWVEVTRGNIKVLLHYPKDGTIFPADPAPLTSAAWNILVTPRYSKLNGFGTTTITSYDRPYLGFGYASDNASGKKNYIVLFHKGQTGWLEVITSDKNSFIQQFKFDPESLRWDSETDLLNPLIAMFNYNRFAVAASDFTGRWSSDFTGIQQLYNVYTGQYAGMNINQSNEEFNFKADNNYDWKLLAVNGIVGSIKASQVKSSGNFTTPNNWQVKFSMIENKAKTYHAFWSCIKDARVLNLLDADSPGSGIYTRYGKAK